MKIALQSACNQGLNICVRGANQQMRKERGRQFGAEERRLYKYRIFAALEIASNWAALRNTNA